MTIHVTLAGNTAYVFTEEDGEEHEAEEGTEAGHEDDGVTNPVIPAKNEIFYAALFFFALWALMKYVLLPPIMAVRAERDDKVRAARDSADMVDSDLGEATSEYDATIGAARDEANAILATAREDAEAHRSRLQAAADEEITGLRSNADAELAEARATALASMRGDVGDLAVGAASRVIGTNLDRSAQQSIIDSVLGS
ncbi:MAG: F0F1 ATP synthase subunit B [Acidimicrobiales bacterium]